MTTVASWLSELRADLEDFPETIVDNYTTTDTVTTKIQLSNFPVNVISLVKVNAVTKVETTDWTMDYDRGLLTLLVAPGNAQLVEVTYTKVRFRDARIIDSLAMGVRGLYPKVYVRGEVYVLARNMVTEYDLTDTTDVPAAITGLTQVVSADQTKARTAFANPQTTIHYAESLMTGGSGPDWEEWNFFHRMDKRLHLTSECTEGTVIRLTYSAAPTVPAAAGDTIDVPDAYYMLPKWYALGALIGRKEIQRDNSDTYTVMQNQNAVPPRMQTVLKQDFFADYYRELKERPMRPMRHQIRKGLVRRG